MKKILLLSKSVFYPIKIYNNPMSKLFSSMKK